MGESIAMQLIQHEAGGATSSTTRASTEGGCQIIFDNLCYSVPVTVVGDDKKKVVREKSILQSISGVFHPSRFTAIMGASGAGKTSFLNVIAGEASVGNIDGRVLVNGQEIVGKGMKEISGFVFQDDVILPTMTVREAISMSAKLRLPEEIPPAEKEARVEKIISDLNLTKCAETIIGDTQIKGVSGGERKRCAMAMEMVTNPQILFLDEPTSGLDTFTAFSVIDTLRKLASTNGQTIVATIHQPSSEIFHLFDDLLLLADGCVMYQGPAKQAVPYFASLGFKCSRRSNPADYFFYHILNNQEGAAMPPADKSTKSIDSIDETNDERIKRLLVKWTDSPENRAMMEIVGRPRTDGVPSTVKKSRASFGMELSFLFDRESKNVFRNVLIVRSRTQQTVFMALVVGLLYLKKSGETDFQLRQNVQGVLFFLAINNVFMSCQSHLSSFGREKAVFSREHSAGYYGLPSFFISKVFVELPMQIIFPWSMLTIIYFMAGLSNDVYRYFELVGISIEASISGFALGVCLACAFPSLPVALAVTPVILMPLMLFSGLFVNSATIPVWIRWLKYFSPMKYAFQGAIISQLGDTPAGDDIVKALFSDESLTVTACSCILLAMFIACLALAYWFLFRLVSQSAKVVKKKNKT